VKKLLAAFECPSAGDVGQAFSELGVGLLKLGVGLLTPSWARVSWPRPHRWPKVSSR